MKVKIRKNSILPWIVGSMVLLAGGISGLHADEQPTEGAQRERYRGGEQARERAPRERVGNQRGRAPHMERWMERLRENDPETYQRMADLREEQPVAFRMELRRRVHEARWMHRVREEQPGFYDYLQGLPAGERAELCRFLEQTAGEVDEGRRSPRRLLQPRLEGDGELREQVEDWKAAETPEEREAIAAKFRAHLRELFDERTAEQKEEIERAEKQVERLRHLLQQREENRDQWIERLISRLLRNADKPRRQP